MADEAAFSYAVRCEFADGSLAAEWLAWMRDEHLAAVLAAGARGAELVRVDGAAIVYEARYRFASRAAFADYEREHAPRLRAEGLRLFPPGRGVRYTRETADVLARV